MIVVFGGDGQLGRELVDAAESCNSRVLALSHVDTDIAEAAQVHDAIKRFTPSLVVNAAAYTDVERAEIEPHLANRVNAEGARVVAATCQQLAIPLIHISTDFVFDGAKSAPYRETDEVRPLNTYGKSKAAGEAHVMTETEHYAIVRTSWLFSKTGRNFVKTILALAHDRDEIEVVCDEAGCPTSARSLAFAILHMAPRLSADRALSGLYHFAGTPAISRYAFATHIIGAQAQSTGRAPRVIATTSANYGTRTQRPAHSALDCTKIKRTFDIQDAPWQPEVIDVVNALVATARANNVT
jgi:dTDP-4-dehydrorhamnose reductase